MTQWPVQSEFWKSIEGAHPTLDCGLRYILHTLALLAPYLLIPKLVLEVLKTLVMYFTLNVFLMPLYTNDRGLIKMQLSADQIKFLPPTFPALFLRLLASYIAV